MFGKQQMYGGLPTQAPRPMGGQPMPGYPAQQQTYGQPSPYGQMPQQSYPQQQMGAYPQQQMPQQMQQQPQMQQQQMQQMMQQNPMLAQAQQMMQSNPQVMQNQQALMQYMPQIHNEYLQTERGQSFQAEMQAYQEFVKAKLQGMGLSM